AAVATAPGPAGGHRGPGRRRGELRRHAPAGLRLLPPRHGAGRRGGARGLRHARRARLPRRLGRDRDLRHDPRSGPVLRRDRLLRRRALPPALAAARRPRHQRLPAQRCFHRAAGGWPRICRAVFRAGAAGGAPGGGTALRRPAGPVRPPPPPGRSPGGAAARRDLLRPDRPQPRRALPGLLGDQRRAGPVRLPAQRGVRGTAGGREHLPGAVFRAGTFRVSPGECPAVRRPPRPVRPPDPGGVVASL
ncbi:MAG: hypothetical protein AVDCRST_MAG88-2778, partial [uncultured Thermomicrobiales bacterium]